MAKQGWITSEATLDDNHDNNHNDTDML
jgi:hypothetical protein